MIIFQVNSESDCADWLGRHQGRSLGYFSVLTVLLGLLSRPRRKLPFHLSYLPSTQAPERFSLEKPVLQLNVLAFGWNDQKPQG